MESSSTAPQEAERLMHQLLEALPAQCDIAAALLEYGPILDVSYETIRGWRAGRTPKLATLITTSGLTGQQLIWASDRPPSKRPSKPQRWWPAQHSAGLITDKVLRRWRYEAGLLGAHLHWQRTQVLVARRFSHVRLETQTRAERGLTVHWSIEGSATNQGPRVESCDLVTMAEIGLPLGWHLEWHPRSAPLPTPPWELPHAKAYVRRKLTELGPPK